MGRLEKSNRKTSKAISKIMAKRCEAKQKMGVPERIPKGI